MVQADMEYIRATTWIVAGRLVGKNGDKVASPETKGGLGRFSTVSSASSPRIFSSSHHGASNDSFVPTQPGYLRLTLTKDTYRGADPPAACPHPRMMRGTRLTTG